MTRALRFGLQRPGSAFGPRASRLGVQRPARTLGSKLTRDDLPELPYDPLGSAIMAAFGTDVSPAVTADRPVGIGEGYIPADTSGGDVTITYDASNTLLRKEVRFHKTTDAGTLNISDGSSVVWSENATKPFTMRQVDGALKGPF